MIVRAWFKLFNLLLRIIHFFQFADTASAATLTIPNGQVGVVTGNTAIDFITTTGYNVGDFICLALFNAATPARLNHATGGVPANTAALSLRGAVNYTPVGFSAANLIVLQLITINGVTRWVEQCRSDSTTIGPNMPGFTVVPNGAGGYLAWGSNSFNLSTFTIQNTGGVFSFVISGTTTGYTFSAPLTVKAGLATSLVASVGGHLDTSIAPAGSPASTFEGDLKTYSLAANTLGTNLNKIRYRAWGTTVASAVFTERIRMYFGAIVMFDTGALVFDNKDWYIDGTIIRESNVLQVTITLFAGNDLLVTQTFDYSGGAETLSGAVTMKCTGQSSDGTANNIVQQGHIIEWLP